VALKTPGSKQKITVLRQGKRKRLTVTIGKLPDQEPSSSVTSVSMNDLGLDVQTLTPDLARQFGLQNKKGVVVTQVISGSYAAQAGIKAGTVIKTVNRKPVATIEEFERLVTESLQKGSVLLLVRDGQYSRYVALKIK